MITSEVGRIASGSASSSSPPFVTHATCGVKARDVLLLLVQEAGRDEEREVGVDVTGLLEALVERLLDELPDGVARTGGWPCSP